MDKNIKGFYIVGLFGLTIIAVISIIDMTQKNTATKDCITQTHDIKTCKETFK